MIYCTRRIEFDAAHRVIGHQGKCAKLHGHRYAVEAKFHIACLSDIGMVVDFSIIKKKLGGWIDENWDHNVILCQRDEKMGKYIEECTDQKVFYMRSNPTAENMSSYLLQEICPLLFHDESVECIEIKTYETPNCYALASK